MRPGWWQSQLDPGHVHPAEGWTSLERSLWQHWPQMFKVGDIATQSLVDRHSRLPAKLRLMLRYVPVKSLPDHSMSQPLPACIHANVRT